MQASPQASTPTRQLCSHVRHCDLRGALEPGWNRKLLLAEKFRIEQLRLIAGAVVGQYGDDGVSRAKLLGEPDGAGDVDAGGTAEAEALVLEQIEDEGHRLLVGYLVGDVDRRILEILGDAALTDAFGDRGTLGLELAGRVVAVERGAHWIGKRDANRAVALLERHGDAGERAAGADGAGEAVDLAVGLTPDFRPG